jgi:hypothetical protein
MDLVSSPQCGIERLEYQCSNSLSSTVAVGSLIPGKALALVTKSTNRTCRDEGILGKERTGCSDD